MADDDPGFVQRDDLGLDPLQFLDVPVAGPRQQREGIGLGGASTVTSAWR
jgi:hypothetical protein